jgi:hypothetical protein
MNFEKTLKQLWLEAAKDCQMILTKPSRWEVEAVL